MEDQEPPPPILPPQTTQPIHINPSLHRLLLLSDSALPLGSFAFSSGLESFLAHHNISKPKSSPTAKLAAFDNFLSQTLQNLASTSLPYVLAAHSSPSTLPDLDNDFDASTTCTVARRASVSQGRAMLGIWERALSSLLDEDGLTTALSSTVLSSSTTSTTNDDTDTNNNNNSSNNNNNNNNIAAQQLTLFATNLRNVKIPSSSTAPSSPLNPHQHQLQLQAHFAPLFGAVGQALSLPAHETAYLFLLNHAKAVLSAAVRASVMGPYQSQKVLASMKLQETIAWCMENYQGRKPGEAGVTVPAMDLWMGRHELLYSRIFNS